MIKVKKWLFNNLYFIVGISVSLLALATFLWFRIVSVPRAYSLSERAIHNNLATRLYTLSYLWNHTTNAPYFIVLMIPQYLHRYGLFSIRGVGAIFGLISVVVFFYIIWRWWGMLIAFLSTLIFVTSLWFLQSSRNAGPIVLYVVAALLVILLGFVVRNKKRHETKTLFSALIAIVLLYIPGMIWFIVIACLLQRKFVVEEFKKVPVQVKIIIPIASLILLLPLIHSSYSDISNLKTIFGLPLKHSGHAILKNFLDWPLIIFIRNPTISKFSLGHLPMLSIFSDAMFVLGVYWIWTKRNLDRIYLLGASLGLSWILYSLGGPVSIYLALPFIMCIVATGIAFSLSQWFSVFPRNPVARALGISVITISVAAVSWFNINQYFIAWPNSTTTISDYSTRN